MTPMRFDLGSGITEDSETRNPKLAVHAKCLRAANSRAIVKLNVNQEWVVPGLAVVRKAVVGMVILDLLAASPRTMAAPEGKPDREIRILVDVGASAIHDLNDGDISLRGRVRGGIVNDAYIRVTTGRGEASTATVPVHDGAFRCRYPSDFAGAKQLAPTLLFVDASTSADFRVKADESAWAESCVIVYDAERRLFPDLPSAFTNDLLDADSQTDEQSAEWPTIRALTNLYMHSHAARRVGIGRADFDLTRPRDLQYFKSNMALYDFDHRDRDWSAPLGQRVRRTFWQAVWDGWFGPGNDHPLDGNVGNRTASNYLPYTFTNDFADILISHLMRKDMYSPLDDNLDAMCREGIENLLAMQHHGKANFAQRDSKGREHTYTDGAFRYGMFEDGTWLTEGTGWFHNPDRSDYVDGGVFNGRAAWALGEALKRYPDGELGVRIRAAIRDVVRFCLIDSRRAGYTKRTPKGRAYWRDFGESGYVLLGMLAACEVEPGLRIDDEHSLRDECVEVLDALQESMNPCGQWSIYSDHDSVILAALADGVRVLPDHPHAGAWRSSAIKAADGWLNARVDPVEFHGQPVHFGPRIAPGRMSYRWGGASPGVGGRNLITFYKTGHWIHALAKMYRMTGDARYRDRAMRMVNYLCGDNPFRVRILSELGGVYNWVEDTDGDGVEDRLVFDLYPESTAFCQIGIMHLLEVEAIRQGER